MRFVGGPIYSSLRSVSAKINMETFITTFRRIRVIFPPKYTWNGVFPGSAGPTLAALATAFLWYTAWWVLMSDGRCWGSFACVTQDAIFCDFVYVFFVFSSYSGLVLLKS